MIHITLPDGSIKEFETAPTGLEVARSISEGLARDCVAMELDGQLQDIYRPIDADATLRLITTRDEEALDIMRHSAAHVMAQAILRLNNKAKLTIGPVIDDGFYYDIDMEQSLTPDDLVAIEKEMNRIIGEKSKLRCARSSKKNCPSAGKTSAKRMPWYCIRTSPISWK